MKLQMFITMFTVTVIMFITGCANDNFSLEEQSLSIIAAPDLASYCADRSAIHKVKEFTKQHHKTLVFDSGNNSEQNKCIPVQVPYSPVLVYSIKLKNIKRGDVLTFSTYGEVSNDYSNSTIMVAEYAELSTGHTLSESRGTNLDSLAHHMTFFDGGIYEFKIDCAEISVNIYVYAATTQGSLYPGIRLEQDYGRIYGEVQ